MEIGVGGNTSELLVHNPVADFPVVWFAVRFRVKLVAKKVNKSCET